MKKPIVILFSAAIMILSAYGRTLGLSVPTIKDLVLAFSSPVLLVCVGIAISKMGLVAAR